MKTMIKKQKKAIKSKSALNSNNNLLTCIKRDKLLYLMLIPFLAYYLIFYYKPFTGLVIAFQDYKPLLGIEGSDFVGFENFVDFFTGPHFTRTLRNTLLISFYNIIFAFPAPIILALLFHEVKNKKFRAMAQTISYIPRFISTVVIAGLIVNFLSPSGGIVNIILQNFGIEPIYFLAKPEYFRTIFVVQNIWATAGFSSIIYYSSLCSIDASLYEAVTIDGGGRWRQVWHISLPSLVLTISIMLIMQIGNILNVSAEMIILLYLPVTYETADTISSYIYRVGVDNANYSLSTAVSMFNGVVSLILVLAANAISKRLSQVSIF